MLHEAARTDKLATTGPHARVRHPQYDGLLLVMIGFLLQWPTIPTLAMFPILVAVYARLARSEEREVATRFGERWSTYAASTPAFVPRRHRAAPDRGEDGRRPTRVNPSTGDGPAGPPTVLVTRSTASAAETLKSRTSAPSPTATPMGQDTNMPMVAAVTPATTPDGAVTARNTAATSTGRLAVTR
ncbi:isoprenylcysteine carboxylmethyltransferase family protein [Pseudofrankia sp. BMG5.37]|nr:isoprenylcysteine carboxylmethyltransferase family protein [Pseudofrankia sp. BMG5.37]MDT3442873.1 isoprenylcysteine carboxylmethyltransferase family protein [Pseudofrankia sp. BMG5.37]